MWKLSVGAPPAATRGGKTNRLQTLLLSSPNEHPPKLCLLQACNPGAHDHVCPLVGSSDSVKIHRTRQEGCKQGATCCFTAAPDVIASSTCP
jgi:hypothetical protein